jgi:lambda repressor-like predicted transcriptional regulator
VHTEDIKAALRKRYKSLRSFEIAKELPSGAVKDVLRGRTSGPTERAICDALNKSPHTVFPARYKPTPGAGESTKADDNTPKDLAHRLISGKV